MDKRWVAVPLVALPLVIGGFVYAASQSTRDKAGQEVSQKGYVCPVTGENLPCPECCPLNESK
jgi:hypothetical protein